MASVRGVLFFAVATAFLAVPAWAAGHEHESCQMQSRHAADADMHHGHDAATPDQARADDFTVEEIPSGTSADKDAHCSHDGAVRAAKCGMNMPRCNMSGGCCIKGAGPLSTGAKDSAAGQEDNMNLPVAYYLNADERSGYLPGGDLDKVELFFSPIPRPPSA